MGNRCFRHDPMAQRIEIALDGDPVLDVVAGKIAIDHPVKANSIDRHMLCVAQNRCSGTARKPNDLGPGDLASYDFNDSPRGFDAPAGKFLRPKYSGPSIENLHRVGTGLK